VFGTTVKKVAARSSIVLCVVAGFFLLVSAQTLQDYRTQVGRLIRDYHWKEALELAMTALDHYPRDPQLLVAAAALAMQAGQADQGERLIESAVSVTVSDPDLLGIMAELKLSRGSLAGASHLFERALLLAPKDPRLHYRFSRLLFTKGDEVEALDHAAAAVRLDPERADYRRFYASMLEQAGRTEEAYEQLRLARMWSPGDARILLRLSDSVKKRGRLEEALEYLEMASTIDPENPLYQRELEGVYHALGAVVQAEEARLRGVSLEEAFRIYSEAVLYLSRGEEDEATAILEPVVSEHPEFITGAILLADLYRKLGKKQKALALYQSVLERDPARARIREETAWLHADQGELETALEILEGIDPESVNLALLEGYRRLVDSDWAGAMNQFKVAEKRYPLNSRILEQISLCLHSMGRPSEALAYLEKAHRVEPDNGKIDGAARLVRFEYGLELEKKGRWNEALAVFQRLKEEDDEEADYFFHEAYCHQNLWDYGHAVELYRKGLRLDPQAEWVRINLATCLYALSRYDEAAEQWKKLVEASPDPEYVYNFGLARIRQWRLQEGWKLVAEAAEAGFEPAQELQRARNR